MSNILSVLSDFRSRLKRVPLDSMVAEIAATNPFMFLVSLLERILVIAVQVSLSLIVWVAVNTKGKKWLYILAVFLHAAIDLPAMMLQVGILKSIFVIEALLAFGVAGTSALAVFLYRKYCRISLEKDQGMRRSYI